MHAPNISTFVTTSFAKLLRTGRYHSNTYPQTTIWPISSQSLYPNPSSVDLWKCWGFDWLTTHDPRCHIVLVITMCWGVLSPSKGTWFEGTKTQNNVAAQPLPYSENGLVLTRGGVLRIYEYISSIYILHIIFSVSFTYRHTDYIPISDCLHVG
jgi:hypothetical protein